MTIKTYKTYTGYRWEVWNNEVIIKHGRSATKFGARLAARVWARLI